MKSPSSKIAIAIGLCLGSGIAPGMGFGQAVTHRAIFGLPLDMSVSVRMDPGERFDPACVHADVLFGETRVEARQVRIDISRVHADERMVRVRTVAAIDEPVVSVHVSAGCEKVLARKIVAFADPPPGSLLPESPKVGSSPSVARRSGAASAAEAGSLVASPGGREKRVVDVGAVLAGEGTSSGQVTVSKKPKSSTPLGGGNASARISPPVSADSGSLPMSRLRLDPLEIDARVYPTLKLSGGVPSLGAEVDENRRLSASSLWRVMNASPEELALQQTRLAQLEMDLGRLKKDADQTGTVVSDLRSKLAESEQRQVSNPVMYALAAVVVAMAGGIVMLMRRRVQPEEAQDSWWAPSEQGSGGDFPGDSEFSPCDVSEGLDPRRPGMPLAPDASAWVSRGDVAPPSIQVSTLLTNDWAKMSPQRHDSGAVGIDQLYDLEKQVSFYLSLGQDEAAIDLLGQHVQSPGAVSPMPYLKLFELYQERGAQSAFEQLSEEFFKRFAASAPEWDADLADVHGLADYPEWIEPLVKAWDQPQQALDLLLDGLLHRHASSLLDEPAYSDMLALALVARDRFFEHQVFSTDGCQTVDLELPLDDGGPAPAPFASSMVQPMLATSPLHIQMNEPKTLPLSIDLELESLDGGPHSVSSPSSSP